LEGTDELDCLRRDRDAVIRNGHGVRLAILPTSACDFSCLYCYQRPDSTGPVMSHQTEENLVNFTHRLLSSLSQGPLVVMWFGGEPLLALNIVRRLSAKLIAIADNLRVDYHSSMVTNGYRLDLLTPQVISELRLSTIQVTVDGPQEVHDQRRPRKGGRPTFERIVANVASVSRYFPGIIIRINVDGSNFEQVPSLLVELRDRDILENCRYTTAAVDLNTGVCVSDSCPTFKPEEWGKVDDQINVEAQRLGVAHLELNRLPNPGPLACYAQAANAFVVDPEGLLYKCLNDTPIRARAVYDVNNSIELNSSRAFDLQASSPFGCPECENCLYLPLCNAGCPAVNIDGGSASPLCTHFRFSLKPRLTRYVRDYLSRDRQPFSGTSFRSS